MKESSFSISDLLNKSRNKSYGMKSSITLSSTKLHRPFTPLKTINPNLLKHQEKQNVSPHNISFLKEVTKLKKERSILCQNLKSVEDGLQKTIKQSKIESINIKNLLTNIWPTIEKKISPSVLLQIKQILGNNGNQNGVLINCCSTGVQCERTVQMVNLSSLNEKTDVSPESSILSENIIPDNELEALTKIKEKARLKIEEIEKKIEAIKNENNNLKKVFQQFNTLDKTNVITQDNIDKGNNIPFNTLQSNPIPSFIQSIIISKSLSE